MELSETGRTAVLGPGERTETAVPEAIARRVTQDFRGGPAAEPRTGPRSSPVPTPLPMMAGHRVLIYKQDPSVGELGIRTLFVPSTVLNGPADARVRTELPGVTPVARNVDGDLIFPPNSPEFDCAHTFAVVRSTLAMYERHNGGAPIPFAWNSAGDTGPITVFPRAGVDRNAFYSRVDRSLRFFFFTPAGSGREVMTCRSLDIVAHETGHAILDGLKPGWLGVLDNPPQTGGLHEAFGDLTAIFLTLSQADQAEAIVSLTKANLHAKSFLPAVAEEFGAASSGLALGLRNADNDLRLSDVGNKVHDISQVFTGGVYDVLADVYAFELARQRRVKSPTQILMDAASGLCRLLFDAVVAAPARRATYADVVGQMLRLSANRDDPTAYRSFILNRFSFREVVAPPAPITELMSGEMDLADPHWTGGLPADVTGVEPADGTSASLRAMQDRSGCCGTMQMPEFNVVPADRLAGRGPLSDEDILARELAELREAFEKADRNR